MRVASKAIQPSAPGSLAERYRSVRAHSLALAAPLSPEDCQIQSMPDASPVKWHLAHTSWFFETVILAQRPGYRPFDARFAYLFNSYYEALGPRHPRPRRGLITRPTLDEVLTWRAHVDAAMEAVLDDAAFADAILLGLNHEQQHQELILTDIQHAFFANPLLPAYRTGAPPPAAAAPLQWHSHPGGIVRIGHDGDGFAFDNETPRHDALLRPLRIASRPVSNGEYSAFIADGGYRRPEFWLSDGWALVQAEGWEAPLYWLTGDGAGDTTQAFTLWGPQPLDENAPVRHVSFFEAAAYAAWAKRRLPTEFEWEALSGAFDHGQVWEWTRSSYDPYPGFQPFEGIAAEYNGKFMVGQMVLRGGSCATPDGHMRPTYRNFFPPHARWQFSGIRLAEDI
ncbi:MAG: ergothioneine biosynthesis protein EgtB [Alphaproteobacteria bacterium]|nr:ergothioneine biosynthesis protein EgtB [Alphaproteobacteria bacterium]